MMIDIFRMNKKQLDKVKQLWVHYLILIKKNYPDMSLSAISSYSVWTSVNYNIIRVISYINKQNNM